MQMRMFTPFMTPEDNVLFSTFRCLGLTFFANTYYNIILVYKIVLSCMRIPRTYMAIPYETAPIQRLASLLQISGRPVYFNPKTDMLKATVFIHIISNFISISCYSTVTLDKMNLSMRCFRRSHAKSLRRGLSMQVS